MVDSGIRRYQIEYKIDQPITIEHATAEKYDTLVLDHITGFYDLILKEVLGITEIPVQKSWGLATMQQYGEVGVKFKEIMRALLSYNGNVVLVAGERMFGTKEEGQFSELMQPTVGCALTDKLAGWVNQGCDYICQTFIRPKMEQKTIEVAGNSFYPARDMIKANDELSDILHVQDHLRIFGIVLVPAVCPVPAAEYRISACHVIGSQDMPSQGAPEVYQRVVVEKLGSATV